MSRADELVEEHLRGGIDAAALDSGLRGELAAHPEEVTGALLLLRLHGQLAGEARPAGLAGRIMAAVAGQARVDAHQDALTAIIPPPRSRRRLVPVGFGLAAVALLVGAALAWSLAGGSGVGIASGAWLRPDGGGISSGALPRRAVGSAAVGGVVLSWQGGSLAEVAGGSRLHLEGDDLALDAGSARCTVGPRAAAAPFSVRTPHATLTGAGAVFTVAVGDATTCRVERGTVAFACAGQERRLHAGMAVTSDALAAAPAGWELVWADEFAAAGAPAAQRWRDWTRQSDLDIPRYAPGLARIADGALVLEAHHDPSGWTSTSVIAQGLVLHPGMRVELRAQLPLAPGVWPRIWAVQPERWPEGPEVVLLTTSGAPAHLRTALRLAPAPASAADGPPAEPAYSVYAIVWTETGLTLWRDGASVCTVVGPDDSAWADACAGGLRLAMELTVTAEAAPERARLLVDWVRVYRRAAAK